MQVIKIGIIGVGGYAQTHLSSIRYCEKKGICLLEAAVIRNPNKPGYKEIEEELKAQGVRIYRDYGQMLITERGRLDLIAAPGGIDQHEEQAIAALEAGYHVMCEKPAAGTVAESMNMLRVSEKTGKYLAIGYQQIFTASIQKIKQLTISQQLGKLLKAKTYVLWPRTSQYYSRNSWAGKMKIGDKWIYDCPIQNATAHFLNNMLYIAGPRQEESAQLRSIYAENYLAKDNEAPETQYLRITSANGVVIHHIASHAVDVNVNPVIHFYYEQGKVEWQLNGNGQTKVYKRSPGNEYLKIDEFNNGEENPKDTVFVDTCAAIREGRQPLSNIHNSWQQVRCVEGSFAAGPIIRIPEEYLLRLPVAPNPDHPEVDTSGDENVVIKEVAQSITRMCENEQSFSEYGLPWARPGKTINVKRKE